MNSFLKQVTTTLYQQWGSDLSHCIMVFPNRRSGVFFAKYLKELSTETIWSPRIQTISEFLQMLSPLQIEDSLGLLFRLYKVYVRHLKSNESFDEFYHWGEMLLNDFDDLDKYRVDAKHLFQNLADEKNIDSLFDYLTPEQIEAIQSFWRSFHAEKYSKHQNEFISLWEKLSPIYTDFKAELQSQQLAYEGMATRQLVEQLEKGEIEIDAKRIVFIGFNALNRCEIDLFSVLKQRNIADFYWDYDNIYVKNELHEAGLFMRSNIKQFPSAKSHLTFDNIIDVQKNIHFVALPSDVGQVKYAHGVIDSFFQQKDVVAEETAVVLADEELLIPVLHAIPQSVSKVNVTMGYPAKNTPIAGLLSLIIDLQKSARKGTFSHKQVMAILNHQYINAIQPEVASSICNHIITHNSIDVEQELLQENKVFAYLFEITKGVTAFTSYLLHLLQQIYQQLQGKNEEEQRLIDKIEQEYIYHLFLNIKRLQTLIQQHDIELNQDTFFKILEKLVQSLTIPFEGESLAGLQVMGILETRLLDFKNIIVLSMNEGKLPKTSSTNSFIPYHLRKGFGLPTIDHQDAIFAYYFYRLIQRAENINLLYSTQSDGMRTGEMSRFMYQIKYELPLPVTESAPSHQITVPEVKPIEVPKNQRVLEHLNRYCGNLSEDNSISFSPSALNTYLNCQLSFYFKYLAKFKEPDMVTEEIDPPTFGNIFHHTMEELYSLYKDTSITSEILTELKNNTALIEQKLKQAFAEKYFNTTKEITLRGRNSLIFDILKRFVIRNLEIDQQFTPFRIVDLEGEYTAQIALADGRKVNLKGSIDRVDQVEQQIRIIDYKTGKAELKFPNVESLFEQDSRKRNKAAFQTLLYCLFYNNSGDNRFPLAPAVYKLSDFFNKEFNPLLVEKEGRAKGMIVNDYQVYKVEFENHLTDLLEEIFNKDIPFQQTQEVESCQYCPYAIICHR